VANATGQGFAGHPPAGQQRAAGGRSLSFALKDALNLCLRQLPPWRRGRRRLSVLCLCTGAAGHTELPVQPWGRARPWRALNGTKRLRASSRTPGRIFPGAAESRRLHCPMHPWWAEDEHQAGKTRSWSLRRGGDPCVRGKGASRQPRVPCHPAVPLRLLGLAAPPWGPPAPSSPWHHTDLQGAAVLGPGRGFILSSQNHTTAKVGKDL